MKVRQLVPFRLRKSLKLAKKLYHYGFRGKIFHFLTSYLAKRQICSKFGCIVSSSQIVDHGYYRV